MRRFYWQRLNKAREKVKSLWADRRGVTAIEFSMVALPFFVLAFGIMEVGLAHFANRMVDNAVISASRLVRTGQAGALTESDFKTQICGFMPDFMCNTERIFVEVKPIPSFSAASSTDGLYDDDGNLKDANGFDPGDAGGIVIVNVIYKWPMMTSMLGIDNGDHGDERHLTSTMVFRNEPYN
jgi:TadE-like protein